MTTPKTTGDEPYYPTSMPIDGKYQRDEYKVSGYKYHSGITIKQKFIADFMANGGNSNQARNKFNDYLQVINREQL